MLPRSHPDRIQIAFDDHRLVANAGLMLPATLARRLGLPQLADRCLDLGHAPGRANTGDKLMTLVASAPHFHGGRLWPGATASTTPTRCAAVGPPASWAAWSRPRPPPAFARAGSGHLPAQLPVGPRPPTGPGEPGVASPGLGCRGRSRRRTVDHRPGLHQLRDLRPAKEGARHHRYTHRRGYHPLLAVAAGTGDVLMARLREGQANTGRGAGHFLRETVSRVRYAGAKGQLTMRADSGFYTHPVVRVCRQQKVRFHHRPPAPEPAQSHRGHTRGGLEAHILLDGRRGRRGRDGLYSLQD